MKIMNNISNNTHYGWEAIKYIGYLYFVSWLILSTYLGQLIVKTYQLICEIAKYNGTIAILVTTIIAIVGYGIAVCLSELWRRHPLQSGDDLRIRASKLDFRRIVFVDLPASIGFSALGMTGLNPKDFPFLNQVALRDITVYHSLYVIGFTLLVVTIIINYFYFEGRQVK